MYFQNHCFPLTCGSIYFSFENLMYIIYSKNIHLLKLHSRLRGSSRIQWKNVVRCINFVLFLNISSSCNNLLSDTYGNNSNSILSKLNNCFIAVLFALKTYILNTNLRSYCFNFFALVYCHEHFKEHSGGLVCFTKLSSARVGSQNPSG